MGVFNQRTKTAQDVIKRVQRTFGDEANVQITTSDMFNWINDGQREIAVENPILRSRATADLLSGQSEYPMDSIPILQIQSIRVAGKALKYLNFQNAEDTFANSNVAAPSGDPEFWYNFDGSISLSPTPSSTIAGGLQILYTAMPTDVANLGDKLSVPDTYFNALVTYVLSKAHDLDEDYNAAGQKRGEFIDSLKSLSEQEAYSNNDAYPMITISPEDM